MHRVAAIAARHGARLWLVGGPVRDLLLGRSIVDLDLATDGDVQAIGRQAAAEFEAGFRWHERFLTSVISFDAGHLDLAATRTETYAAPAVLPAVLPAGIEQDLARRDFAINAMAIEIRTRGSGGWIDPFDGRADLAAGTLRILHERSFTDDPTRCFRAARFAARLGFRMERATLGRMRESIADGDPQRLTGERVAAELRRSLKESKPEAVLALLAGWRLGPAWDVPESPTRAGLARLRYAAARLEALGAASRPAIALRLAAVFHDLPRTCRERMARRLRVRRIERRLLVPGPDRAREILSRLGRVSGAGAAEAACRGAQRDTLALAALLADASEFRKLVRLTRSGRFDYP